MIAAEETVKAALERRGYAVFKNGWPDFLCLKKAARRDARECFSYRNGRFEGMCAVEVKRDAGQLTEAQLLVHAVLSRIGVPVYLLRPGTLGSHDVAARAFWTRDDWHAARARLDEMLRQIRAAQKLADELLGVLESTTWCMDVATPGTHPLDREKSDEVGRE